jgi:hypothetical protein
MPVTMRLAEGKPRAVEDWRIDASSTTTIYENIE